MKHNDEAQEHGNVNEDHEVPKDSKTQVIKLEALISEPPPNQQMFECVEKWTLARKCIIFNVYTYGENRGHCLSL